MLRCCGGSRLKARNSTSEIRKKSEIRNPNAAIEHFQLNSSPGQCSSKNSVAADVRRLWIWEVQRGRASEARSRWTDHGLRFAFAGSWKLFLK
jgi:hypothetical protein